MKKMFWICVFLLAFGFPAYAGTNTVPGNDKQIYEGMPDDGLGLIAEQTTSPLQPQIEQTESEKALSDTLKALRQRLERLQTVLDKVTFGPSSYYFTRLRSWVIPLSDVLNDSVSQYFFEVLDNDSSFIESRGDIQVIATPEPSTDLVAMFFAGNNKERKGQRLREALMAKPERNMYRQILESREYSEDKELIDRKFRIVDYSAPQLIKDADSVVVSFDRYSLGSIDHEKETVVTLRIPESARIRFGNMWGFEAKLGYDEFGLPLWTSGNIDFLVLYNQIKVGGHVPFKWGADPNSSVTSIWKPRGLNGTFGATAEFDWAFAGGSVVVGFPRRDVDGTFAQTDSTLYYIQIAAQLWYSFTVSMHQNTNLFRFKMGAGVQQIGRDQLFQPGQRRFLEPIIVRVESRFFWSPYLRVEYLNQQFARRFGLTLQYFRDIGFGSLWLEIIPEHLRIEAKGIYVLSRTRDPWEVPYFFSIAIPYTFSL